MIDRSLSDDGEEIFSHPSPEDDIVLELQVGELLLFVHVEDLKDVAPTSFHGSLQGNDVFLEMHDGTLDFTSGPSDDVELVEELDDGELGSAILICISDRDVSLGLEMGHIELEELRIETQVSKILDLSELEGNCSLHLNQKMISTSNQLTFKSSDSSSTHLIGYPQTQITHFIKWLSA